MNIPAVIFTAFALISPQKTARVVVDNSEPEHVMLAARDMASDVFKITGKELKVLRASRPHKGDVYIRTIPDGRWEAYSVTSGEDGILRFTGSDPRGTMFAIYDFCENYLGVDPMAFWNGSAYPEKKELRWDSVNIEQQPPTFKFRGWFINDEDLLTGWKKGAERYTTYKYYNTVVTPEIMGHVAEALVRSRYNLIIPGTLIWILNPAEKQLLDVCAARGVFLSMHHIEPLGVSAFGFAKYWKDRGKEYEFSYLAHPSEVEEVWKASVRAWSEYPNVVWQLGLRGEGDRPIWMGVEGIPETDEDRAAIISGALKRQVEILDECGIPKENRFSTTTLWAEGSIFNAKGLLDIPEGTTIVFADNSPGWCWQEDFRSTKRMPGTRYGVYYHFALWGVGPHLAPLIPASQTWDLLSEADRTGVSDYAVFNVSNVREFSYNIDAGAKMLWNMTAYNAEKWQRNWLAKHYSSRLDDWISCYNSFHHCLQIHPGNKIPAFLDGMLFIRFNKIRKRLKPVLDGQDAGAGFPKEAFTREFDSDTANFEISYSPGKDPADPFWKSMSMNHSQKYTSRIAEISQVGGQAAAYEMVLRRSETLYATLPEKEKPFAYASIIYPTTLMFRLSCWYRNLMLMEDCFDAGNLPEAKKYQNAALEDLKAVSEIEKTWCAGEFEGWWDDCRKLDIRLSQSQLAGFKFQ